MEENRSRKVQLTILLNIPFLGKKIRSYLESLEPEYINEVLASKDNITERRIENLKEAHSKEIEKIKKDKEVSDKKKDTKMALIISQKEKELEKYKADLENQFSNLETELRNKVERDREELAIDKKLAEQARINSVKVEEKFAMLNMRMVETLHNEESIYDTIGLMVKNHENKKNLLNEVNHSNSGEQKNIDMKFKLRKVN